MTTIYIPAYKLRRRIAATIFLAFGYLVLLGPILYVALASFDYGQRAYVVFPPERFTIEAYLRIPPRYWNALGVSLIVALATTVIACLIGIPAAMGIVRGTFKGKSIVLAILRAPLQIPAVVAGVAFLQAYYVIGAATGWYGASTFEGLIVAHVFAATPYLIGTLVSSLQRFDTSIEEAALILGATPLGTLRQVTLPMMRPGIFAGALYAFMISFGEVPMSVFLTSGRLVTLPVEIFNSMQFDFEPVILAISTLVTILSLATVWAVQRAIGLDIFINKGAAE